MMTNIETLATNDLSADQFRILNYGIECVSTQSKVYTEL
ncbi:protein of unknown function [Vibrio tapetis subsp. tapetis]|uniref:Uncharacterized protein n=2 Tax=Vibrio tapetis subsp. tapetis TaxID=1671868 RepID=A0A2N8ZHS8_9VIBR|nr:protein of unknown function [Vibrio tapetis subsp. tapetis]SON51447.1 protein of unknown function [Vibrio tapetis subsp. tapetis]